MFNTSTNCDWFTLVICAIMFMQSVESPDHLLFFSFCLPTHLHAYSLPMSTVPWSVTAALFWTVSVPLALAPTAMFFASRFFFYLHCVLNVVCSFFFFWSMIVLFYFICHLHHIFIMRNIGQEDLSTWVCQREKRQAVLSRIYFREKTWREKKRKQFYSI